MSKPETRFYTAVHRLLPAKLHKEKMANPYRGGTADVWYSGTADDLWVEYKYVTKVPKTAGIAVSKELSALQLQWLRLRHTEGRNVVVILGTPIGAWVYEFCRWETELVTASQLTHSGLTKQQVADYIRNRVMLPCSSNF
jgi:hypothetical protein